MILAYSHTVLTDFYVKSYHIIRKYSDSALVIFNELYAKVERSALSWAFS